jgi:lipoprotein-releasing system permease protein
MIAARYLRAKRRESVISVISVFSLLGIMIGVAALIIVMSVMNGFRAELFDKVVGLNGHAVIQGNGGPLDNWRPIVAQARQTPGVTSVLDSRLSDATDADRDRAP